ncbi:MAG: hypothetical protein CL828_05585 [Crocinitomicaceae bacterium]|nr:hypothetical protein [Crocinitomicaceae bacterium]
MLSSPATPPEQQTAQAQLEQFMHRVNQMIAAYETQNATLQRLKAELASVRLENEKLTSQIEISPRDEVGQLQLDVVEDSPQTFLPQSHQSDSPSIDRVAVQALLSDIEECIAILES